MAIEPRQSKDRELQKVVELVDIPLQYVSGVEYPNALNPNKPNRLVTANKLSGEVVVFFTAHAHLIEMINYIEEAREEGEVVTFVIRQKPIEKGKFKGTLAYHYEILSSEQIGETLTKKGGKQNKKEPF